MKAARGFTLIEILAALTMFAVVGGTLLQLFGSGLRGARIASEHAHAALLARSKLTELQAYRHLKPAILEGDFGDGYRWEAVLTPPTDAESEGLGSIAPLYVDLTVRWGERDDEDSLTVKTILLAQVSGP